MRYYNNKRYNSTRRSRRLRKMFEKMCPKANYCKNADRCDYELPLLARSCVLRERSTTND